MRNLFGYGDYHLYEIDFIVKEIPQIFHVSCSNDNSMITKRAIEFSMQIFSQANGILESN